MNLNSGVGKLLTDYQRRVLQIHKGKHPHVLACRHCKDEGLCSYCGCILIASVPCADGRCCRCHAAQCGASINAHETGGER